MAETTLRSSWIWFRSAIVKYRADRRLGIPHAVPAFPDEPLAWQSVLVNAPGSSAAFPEHLVPYLSILRAAFPSTPQGEERRAVLALLFSDMSEEGLSVLGAEFFDDERVLVLHEAIRATTDRPVDNELRDRVRGRLEAAGWDFTEDE